MAVSLAVQKGRPMLPEEKPPTPQPPESFVRRVFNKVIEDVTVKVLVTVIVAALSVLGAAIGTGYLAYTSVKEADTQIDSPTTTITTAPAKATMTTGMSVDYGGGLTVTVLTEPACAPLRTDSTKSSCTIQVKVVNGDIEPRFFYPAYTTYLEVGPLRFPVEYDFSWPTVFPGRSETATLKFTVPVGSEPTRLQLKENVYSF